MTYGPGDDAADASDRILARLTGLHPKRIDLSLGRLERLLARLDHPERRLPPVVHAAGTNGKGSTLATLGAILEAAGLRVHRYTSPHLVRFNERVRLNGADIAEPDLARALDVCERANGGEPITFFEITTAAAFLAFADTPADVLLLETGLGGRLDATNVVARPRLTALTPIALDHQDFLGDDLTSIAFEKAGILKPSVPCVVGPQPAEALSVIERRAAAVGAPLLRHGVEWSAERRGEGLRVVVGGRRLDLPASALPGVHQTANAGLAVAMALHLGDRVSEAHMAAGLRATRWPARLQRLVSGPLVEGLPGWEVWLDGGHNPAAGAVLADSLIAMPAMPLHLIVGMMANKDAAGFLSPLRRLTGSLCAVPVPGEANGRDPADLAATARTLGFAAGTAADAESAACAIAARGPARVLVCGSLYLAGDVLRRGAAPGPGKGLVPCIP